MSADVTTLMNQLVSDINARAFTIGGSAVNAMITKLPLKQDFGVNANNPNAIIVCPGKAETYRRTTFDNHFNVEAGILVVIIAMNLTSATANEDTLLTMRQTIAGIISSYGPTTLTNLLMSKVVYNPPFDASMMENQAWDYVGLEGRFTLFY